MFVGLFLFVVFVHQNNFCFDPAVLLNDSKYRSTSNVDYRQFQRNRNIDNLKQYAYATTQERDGLSEIPSFAGKDFQGMKLPVKNGRRANLAYFNFSEADFRNADLSDVDLRGVNLTNAWIDGAKFNNANLSGAILHKARTNNAKFTGTIMNGADCRDTLFEGVQFKNAHFKNAKLQGSIFKNCNCSYATFEEANFENATLINPNFAYAIFIKTNFTRIKAYIEYNNIKDLLYERLIHLDISSEVYGSIKEFLDNWNWDPEIGQYVSNLKSEDSIADLASSSDQSTSVSWKELPWSAFFKFILTGPVDIIKNVCNIPYVLLKTPIDLIRMIRAIQSSCFYRAEFVFSNLSEESFMRIAPSDLTRKKIYFDQTVFNQCTFFRSSFDEEQLVNAVLNHCAMNDRLGDAIKKNDLELVRVMLRFGVNPNQLIQQQLEQESLSKDSIPQLSALIYTLKHKQESIAIELLRKPDMSMPEWSRRKTTVNPLLCDNKGNNALHWAVKQSMNSIVHQLSLHAKSSELIHHSNSQGLTPLELAASQGDKALIGLLIKKFGCSSDQKLFSVAFDYGKEDLIDYLLQSGGNFDVNAQDQNGSTALHHGAMVASVKDDDQIYAVVEKIISAGAARNIRNNKGIIPLYYARLKGRDRLEEILNAPQVSDQELLNIGTEDLSMLLNGLHPESDRSLHSFIYSSEAEVLAVKQSLQEKVTHFNAENNRNVQFLDYATMEVNDDEEEVEDIYTCLLTNSSSDQTLHDLTPTDLFEKRYKTASWHAPSILFINKLHELAKGDGMLGTLKRELESRDYKGVMVISTMLQSEVMESALQNRLAVDMRPASFILTQYQRKQLLECFFGLRIPQLQLNDTEFNHLVEKTAGMDRDDLENFVQVAEVRARNENGLPGCVTYGHFNQDVV